MGADGVLEKLKSKTQSIIRARTLNDTDRLEMLEILYATFYRALDNTCIPNTTSIPVFRDVRDLLETSLRYAAKDKRECLKSSDVHELNLLLIEAEKQKSQPKCPTMQDETQA